MGKQADIQKRLDNVEAVLGEIEKALHLDRLKKLEQSIAAELARLGDVVELSLKNAEEKIKQIEHGIGDRINRLFHAHVASMPVPAKAPIVGDSNSPATIEAAASNDTTPAKPEENPTASGEPDPQKTDQAQPAAEGGAA